ncbi:hypothetical protein Tco_0831574 [Tanacetum coccineum]
MAVRTQPTLSPSYSAKLTEAMGKSPSSFRKRQGTQTPREDLCGRLDMRVEEIFTIFYRGEATQSVQHEKCRRELTGNVIAALGAEDGSLESSFREEG